jgi:hypothetical protein
MPKSVIESFLKARNMFWNIENIALARRIMVRVLIVVALYPILLGGVANMHVRYRARWAQMRQEHRDAMQRDRERRIRMGTDYRSDGVPMTAPITPMSGAK